MSTDALGLESDGRFRTDYFGELRVCGLEVGAEVFVGIRAAGAQVFLPQTANLALITDAAAPHINDSECYHETTLNPKPQTLKP